ncbi:GNAT family N-acetyltransferase [Bacillus daqingensis]|uniref:GNAT family N-acetyltransferase n=1 Tax=Bacillus daqingensis TaxID=872396 RepID=A0ABV9NRA0_9BACI
MMKGISHLCFAVSDLQVSLTFYQTLFQAEVHAVGRTTAYLTAAGVWIALNQEKKNGSGERASYTHTAFSADEEDLVLVRERLKQMNREPVIGRDRSERDKASFYVQDPDGHLLEFHTGSLEERLAYYREEKPHMSFPETKPVIKVAEETGKREPWIDDLLMADESREEVEAYMHSGTLYRMEADGETAGVLLLVPAENKAQEIRNMAVRPVWRGKGVGREALEQIAVLCRSSGVSRLLVGTANSSIGNLAFYQRAGFRLLEIRRGYFERYPEPFYEHGIQGRDMVMLERQLEAER